MSDYPYATGDLLEERNTYFYTEYRGAPFLKEWIASRDEAAGDAGPSSDAAAGAFTDKRPSPTKGNVVPVDTLIAELRIGLDSEGVPGPEALEKLETFLRRFEVSKRIYAAYNSELRAADRKDYHALSAYVSAAELFELAYHRTEKLPYLNGLLKILDTLCALRSCLGAQEQEKVRALVAAEREHVQSLAASCGVRL